MAPMKSPARRDDAGADRESWSLTHLSRHWKVSRRKVRRLLQLGILPFEEVAGQVRVPRIAIEQLERDARNFLKVRKSGLPGS